jgi:hypothetical protein
MPPVNKQTSENIMPKFIINEEIITKAIRLAELAQQAEEAEETRKMCWEKYKYK